MGGSTGRTSKSRIWETPWLLIITTRVVKRHICVTCPGPKLSEIVVENPTRKGYHVDNMEDSCENLTFQKTTQWVEQEHEENTGKIKEKSPIINEPSITTDVLPSRECQYYYLIRCAVGRKRFAAAVHMRLRKTRDTEHPAQFN